MARPMTVAQMRSQLKKFNQPFVEVSDFAKSTSGRDDETGLDFGPVYGTLNHHTGSDAPDRNNSRLIDGGRSDLPGPLANAGCRDDGVLELFTMGRANHAGKGDFDVYRAIRTENYGNYPPKPNKDEVDGNDCLYGLEIYYSGAKPPTAKAYRAAVNWNAAICDFHDWTAKSAIAHREWTYRKPDPAKIDMAQFREDIDARIAAVNRASNEADDDIIKIMSWNCGPQSEANVLKELRELLPKYTPDVFCGQEFYRIDDDLNIPTYNFRYQYHGPCPEFPNYISEHPANMIVARNTGVVKVKNANEMAEPWKGPKMGLWHSPRVQRSITYNTGETNIRLLDFHGVWTKGVARAESLDFANVWLEQMSKLGPAAVVGDFNASRDEVYEKIAKPNGATLDGGSPDMIVYKNMSKIKGENFGLHGSDDHNVKMWTMRF